MTAVVPNKVQPISARVDSTYGTSSVPVKFVYIDVTCNATSNTTDLATYLPGSVTGILGVMMNSLDGATITTALTWSGTTVTWANDGGSHAVKVILAIY